MFKEPPHPDWLPFFKIFFGYILIATIAILAACIALGKVEESTSYGLPIILGSLTTMAGGFATWAFSKE